MDEFSGLSKFILTPRELRLVEKTGKKRESTGFSAYLHTTVHDVERDNILTYGGVAFYPFRVEDAGKNICASTTLERHWNLEQAQRIGGGRARETREQRTSSNAELSVVTVAILAS